VIFKKKSLWVILLVLTLLTVACSAPADEGQTVEEPAVEQGEAVAMVNGEPIYEGPFQRMTDRMSIVYEQQGLSLEGEEGEVMIQQIQEQTLQQMIQQTVLVQEAKSLELEVPDEAVNAELDQIRSQFETEDAYQEALQQNLFTESELRDTLRMEMTIEALLAHEIPEITVTEEELIAGYNAYEIQYQAQLESIEASGEEISEEEMAMMALPPFEEIKEDLRAQMIQEKEQEFQMAMIDDLMDKSDIEIMI
jgi:peptidyl-prolyl cis-trans isomerase SurA